METCSLPVFIIFTIICVYLSTYAAARPTEDDTIDPDKLIEAEILANELRHLQINSLAYPDEDGLPTTLTPTDSDSELAVENINSYSTTTYPPEYLLKSLLDSSHDLENVEDDDESDNEERQHEILIIVTQTTTATVLTVIVGFLIVCVLFCVLSLSMTIKSPRAMTIAVPPITPNKNVPHATRAISNANYAFDSTKK